VPDERFIILKCLTLCPDCLHPRQVDWSGKTLQIVLGRCTVLELLPGCPQIKKEQVRLTSVSQYH
jgi:hypothetical protein